nr:hypothetical protein [Tanacetum cinerariifolium]
MEVVFRVSFHNSNFRTYDHRVLRSRWWWWRWWRGIWWEVFGGSVVFSGDGVGNGVGGVVCGVSCGVVCGGICWGEVGVVRRRSAMGEVKASISTMIVRVPEKDKWCGTRGKFVRWKGVRVTKASKRANVMYDTSVECFVYYKTQDHVTKGFELHCYWGDHDVDAKWNDY